MKANIRAAKRRARFRLYPDALSRDPFLRPHKKHAPVVRMDARNLEQARRECLELLREAETEETPPGYCRRCKVTRLSRDDRGGLCQVCERLALT